MVILDEERLIQLRCGKSSLKLIKNMLLLPLGKFIFFRIGTLSRNYRISKELTNYSTIKSSVLKDFLNSLIIPRFL